jgi:hypothetical protein
MLRLWIGLAVLLAGGAGFALAGPGALIRSDAPLPYLPQNRGLRVRSVALAFLIVVVASGAIELFNRAGNLVRRHHETFVPSQAQMAVRQCGTLLLAGETATLFYLTHGANKCHVRYLPGSTTGRARDQLAAELATLPRPLLFVAAQPGPGRLVIDNSRPIEIELPTTLPNEIWLRLVAQHGAKVEIRSDTGDVLASMSPVPEADPAWQRVAVPAASASRKLTLMMREGRSRVRFEGLRLSPGQPTIWPWGEDVAVRFENKRSILFSPTKLTGGLVPAVAPLDERGSTFLARVKPP